MQVVYSPAHLGHDITLETFMGVPIDADKKPAVGQLVLTFSTEKLAEHKTYIQALPYMDRLDYVSMLNCLVWSRGAPS